MDAVQAVTNDAREFLAFCGVLGLGRLLAERAGGGRDRARQAERPEQRSGRTLLEKNGGSSTSPEAGGGPAEDPSGG